MKAKSLLFALTLTVLAITAKAQTTFGIRAGVNFQNLNGRDFLDDKLDNKLKTGFNIGVNAEIPVAPEFYVQPGLLFTTKGAKSKDDDDAKVNISYLEIPITFLFKPELGAGKLLLGVGPYIAFGVGGRFTDEEGDDTDIKFESEITSAEYLNAGNIYAFAKRFDAGGNLLAGYELSNKLSFQLNAQLGMVNINPKIEGVSNDKTKIKNTGFGLSVGYRF